MNGYLFYYIDPAGVQYTLTDQVRSFLRRGGMRGFGVLRTEIASARRPYRSGALRLGTPYTPPREMQIALEIIHDSYAEWDAYQRAMRRAVSAYKDTNSLGTLRIVRPDGVVRCIDCWLVEWPDPEMDGPLCGVVLLTFWAPDPFFYDPVPRKVSFQLTSGGLAFPVAFSVTFTPMNIDTRLCPYNAGDVETWPVLVIYGPGTNPAIENETTHQKIAITQEMDAGDHITINMDAGTITWYDASEQEENNIIENISDESEFFPLVRGENVLRCTMESAVSGGITCTFYERYESL